MYAINRIKQLILGTIFILFQDYYMSSNDLWLYIKSCEKECGRVTVINDYAKCNLRLWEGNNITHKKCLNKR